MKIYTRGGDNGSTGVFGGPRVSKDDLRIEAYGTVDELSATIGLSRSAEPPEDIDGQLGQIQSELFSIGAELATPDPEKHGMQIIGASHIARLEAWIDAHEAELPPLARFILPGGSPAASHLHHCRTVCRRAERRVVTMAADDSYQVSATVIVYLNRLSDLLFVLARVANRRSGGEEVEWVRPE